MIAKQVLITWTNKRNTL